MKQRLKAVLAQLAGYIPGPFPTTDDALEAFVADVCAIAGYPLNDGTRHAVATTLSHIDIRRTKVAKQFVVNSLKRAASQQACFNILQDIAGKKKAAKANEEAQ